MRNRTIGFVWAAGLSLAVVVYAVGPDRFLEEMFLLSNRIADTLRQVLLTFGDRTYDAVRALAIASFAVFFALSVVATGRGLPARGLMLVVTLLFLLLVWHEGPEATGHWLLAFILAGSGALTMTRRLTEGAPPSRRP